MCRPAVAVLISLLLGWIPGVLADPAAASGSGSQTVVRLGIDPSFPPVEFVDAQGRHAGLVADYLALLSQRSGLRFEPQLGLSWEAAYRRGLSGEIDVFASVARTPERENDFSFIGPYLTLPSLVITRRDYPGIGTLERLGGETLAVVAGYAEVDLIRRHYPEIRMLRVASVAEGLKAVARGEATATLTGQAVYLHEMQRLGLSNLKAGG
ncbi:MAG TPA: transporter substrate-binding domain-containing protein, partial [Nevskiaceae bacterium]|nr:transporter substrate-binding domain-containing protein [Nevskiaceae bacterium]